MTRSIVATQRDTLESMYARLRAPETYPGGEYSPARVFVSPAAYAIRNARMLLEWRDAYGYSAYGEWKRDGAALCDPMDEDEDARVRVLVLSDSDGGSSALDFDCGCREEARGDFERDDNPLRRMAREYRGMTCRHRAETVQRVERDGAYGIVAQCRAPLTGEWTDTDYAVWGFIGDDWKGADAEWEAMQSALDGLREARLDAAIFDPSLLFEEVA